jgi:hypothetical protein
MRFVVILVVLVSASMALAEDGPLYVRDISKTPDLETDHATMKVLNLNVLARTSDGEQISIDYLDKDGALVETRNRVTPLVAFYHDGPVEHVEDGGAFPGHGQRDVFGAVSLDAGASWKRSNLSRSGDRSSFRLHDGTRYPGDTFRLFAGSAGNKVMVAWASRYASEGNPTYTLSDADSTTLVNDFGIDPSYLHDIWGVTGSQGSSDFADEGYPAVGEVPFAALWTARGTLVDTSGDGEYDSVVWRKAERLTSARRDVHRIEVAGVAGAGFVVTWQEDPEGLRPGEGEGPGEGWSGAVAHHQTDIWYSWIDWEDFDLVDDPADGLQPIDLADYDLEANGTPAVGIPFSIPMRITDNAMCVGVDDDPYVYADLDGDGDDHDLCAYTVQIDTNGGLIEMCVAEDGRLMRGNIAATRARVNLRGYDSNDDGEVDSAWVILAYEESKGLGDEEDLDPLGLIEKVYMGKNIWYHTFDMRNPELVSQGMILNQPAVYPEGMPFDYNAPETSRLVEYTMTDVAGKYDYRFMDIEPDPIYEEQAGLESTLFQTEIARRFSLISQSAADAGPSGAVAFALWKQGIVRQGGPADVYGRRFILPEDFDPTTDNPYDYECMECAEKLFEDVKGICVAPPVCMSGTNLTLSDMGSDVQAIVDAFPWNDYFDDIDLSTTEDGLAKIYEWEQLGPDYGADMAALDPDSTNFDDQSWQNPYDVAKGHRGYMSGDYIMMLYCWSPNWLANTVGHDNYNLYIRRSFDGGVTWTTLPADWFDETTLPADVVLEDDGTEFYEWMGQAGTATEYKVHYSPGAGEFEPARNVSLLVGTRLTVLDPRYARTAASITQDDGTFLYADDERDPTKYFVTFEVGDNTTVEFGEATPLDMYYSRAFNFGDDYEMVLDDTADPLTENEAYFDWLEGKRDDHAAEAALSASPGGMFMWAIWNQWQEDEHENVSDSDAIMRRLLFLDETGDDDGSGGGGGVTDPPNPPRPGGGKPKITVNLGTDEDEVLNR